VIERFGWFFTVSTFSLEMSNYILDIIDFQVAENIVRFGSIASLSNPITYYFIIHFRLGELL